MRRALLGNYRALAAVCALATATTLAIASGGAASASSSVTLQGFALPAGMNNNPGQWSIAPGLNGNEWFVASTGSGYVLAQATTGGAVTELGPLAYPGYGSYYGAMVNGPGSSVWLVAAGNPNLSAIDSSGTQHIIDPGTETDQDLAVGPDGDLYVSDYGGFINQYAVSGTGATEQNHFTATQFPDAIASAGGLIWFSDDYGNLFKMTTSGTVTKVTTAGKFVSTGNHTMLAGPDGDLWAISYGSIGYGGSILRMDPSTGAVLATYPIPHASDPGAPPIVATSLTVGPDGDLWFPLAGDNSNTNGVGQLDPTTGTISTYTMPSGFVLARPGNKNGYAIATGPDNTVWFTAYHVSSSSVTATAAVIEVSGLTPISTTTSTTSTTTTTTSNVSPAASTATTSASTTVTTSTNSTTSATTPAPVRGTSHSHRCRRGQIRRHGRCMARHRARPRRQRHRARG